MLFTKEVTAWKPVPHCAGFHRSPDLLQSGSSRQPVERLELAFASISAMSPNFSRFFPGKSGDSKVQIRIGRIAQGGGHLSCMQLTQVGSLTSSMVL